MGGISESERGKHGGVQHASDRELVELSRAVGDVPAGTFAAVVGRGPDHLLLERVDWSAGVSPRFIAPLDAVAQPRDLAGVAVALDEPSLWETLTMNVGGGS